MAAPACADGGVVASAGDAFGVGDPGGAVAGAMSAAASPSREGSKEAARECRTGEEAETGLGGCVSL